MYRSSTILLILHGGVATGISFDRPLDLMILQETSGGFEEGLRIAKKQLDEIFVELPQISTEIRVGVAEFRDKPYFPLGTDEDFCYRLGNGKLSSSKEDLKAAYEDLSASQGGDDRQAHFQALIDVTLDPNVGWQSDSYRVIALITNSLPHLPRDIDTYDRDQWPHLPQDLPPNPGGKTHPIRDGIYECLHTDYPTPEQVKEVLKEREMALLLLTTKDPDIRPAWKWVNEDLLNQTSNMYDFVTANMENFGEILIKMLRLFMESRSLDST